MSASNRKVGLAPCLLDKTVGAGSGMHGWHCKTPPLIELPHLLAASQADMVLPALRSHIEALDGRLDVIARFPDGAVKIGNFSDLEKAAAEGYD